MDRQKPRTKIFFILCILIFFINVYSKGLIELVICDESLFTDTRNKSSFYENVSSKIVKLLHIYDEDFSCLDYFEAHQYVFSLDVSITYPIIGSETIIAEYIADEFFYAIYWKKLSYYYNFPYSLDIVEMSKWRTRNSIDKRDIKYYIARVCTMPYAGEKLLPMDFCAEWSELYSYVKRDVYKNESNEYLLKTDTFFILHTNWDKYEQWSFHPQL